MKNFVLPFLAIPSFLLSAHAQPGLTWAKKLGGTTADVGHSINVDALGNVYTVGNFTGTADFNPSSGTFSLTSNGFDDVFISKLDASGNFVWAKSIGSSSNENVKGSALDASGNIYFAGSFDITTDFDPGPGIFNLTPPGVTDIYVVKLDPSGNFVWAKTIGAAGGGDVAFDISIDPLGDVLLTGFFNFTVDFDPGPGTFNLTASATDLFVCKLSSAGNFVWARSMGGSSSSVNGRSVRADASGNVFVAGEFIGTVDLDPGAGVSSFSASSPDFYLCKLDAAGNFIWAKTGGGSQYDMIWTISTDAGGNIYTTGGFEGTVDFDPGVGVFNLTSAGNGDIFVTKLDASGNLVWAKNMGGAQNDDGRFILHDTSGNIYVSGIFTGTADLDPGTGTFNLTTSGSNDGFLLKLDNSGNFVWAFKIGSSNSDLILYIASDATSVYITGQFTGTADFDPSATSVTMTPAGSADALVVKYSDCVTPAQPAPISGTTSVCSATSYAYSVTAVSGATSYTWTLPSGWSGTSTTNSITATAGATGGIISVTANSACGSSASQTVNVTVNSVPNTPSTITGNTTVCSGSSQNYSVTNDATATSYTWTLPSGWSGTSTSNSIAATAGATPGNITVTATNACGTSAVQTLSVTTMSIPTTPASISGNTTVCSGTSQTYSVASVAGAASYTWTLPSGWSGTSTTNSINVTPGIAGGSISVTADNSCGNSAAQSITVTVSTVPALPSSITGDNSICEGSSQNYSVTNDVTATSYTWSLPSGWSGTSTSNSITATAGGIGGNVTVTATNGCGTSAVQTLPITVNALPAVTLSLNVSSVCVDNAVFALTGGSPAGGTFTGTGVTGGNFNASSAGVANHTITYSFTDANGCTNSNTDQITVNNCTGISDSGDRISDVIVYPNPFTDELIIDGNFNGETTLVMLNVFGEVVLSTTLNSVYKIETSDLPAGIYFIHLRNSDFTQIKKVVKQ